MRTEHASLSSQTREREKQTHREWERGECVRACEHSRLCVGVRAFMCACAESDSDTVRGIFEIISDARQRI